MSNREQLFEKYIANRLSGDEKQALAELLNDDETIRADFVSYAADWALMASASRQSQRMSTETPAAKPASTIRFPILRRLPAMAAAAVILIAAGLFLLHRPPASDLPSFVTSVQKIGQVQVSGTRFATADKSFCRVNLDDGTVLAMDQNSSISVSRRPETGATMVTRDTGDIYLEVAKQKNPFLIQSGKMNVEVLGTKLHVGAMPTGQPWVDVLEGFTKLISGESGAYVAQGQIGIASAPEAGHDILTVRNSDLDRHSLSWIGSLGLTVPPIVGLASQSGLTDGYRVQSGIWRFDSRDNQVAITQEKGTGDRSILFGSPQWAKGTIAFRFRVLKSPDPEAAVGLLLHYSDTEVDSFAVKEPLTRLAAYDTWLNVRMEFEIGRNDDLIVQTFDCWPEGHPEARWSIPEGIARSRTPANSPIKQRRACNLGLFTSGCAAEFQNIMLGPIYLAPGHFAGGDTGPTVAVPVRADLIAFWSFQNGSSNVVKDISGVGEPMDLTITKPENIEWLKDAIRIRAPADIRYSGSARKIKDAWARTGGMTFEIWIKGSGILQPKDNLEQMRLFCMTTKDGGYLWWNSEPPSGNPDDIGHHVFVLRDEGNTCVNDKIQYKAGTATVVSQTTLSFKLNLHTRPEPIGLHLAPSLTYGSRAKLPWSGDIVAMAIYGRAFTAPEILAASDRPPAVILKAITEPPTEKK